MKVSKQRIVALLLTIPFFPLSCINYGKYGIIYSLLTAIEILGICLIAVKRKGRDITGETWCLIAYVAILIISSLLNGRSPVPAMFYGGRLISFIYINAYYLNKKSTELLHAERDYLTLVILINCFIQLINQNLFGKISGSGNFINFFESDNVLGFYYIPYITLVFLCDYIQSRKVGFFSFFMIVVCAVSLIRAWAAKSLLAMFVFLVYSLFLYNKYNGKLLCVRTVIIVYTVLLVGVLFFNLQNNFSNIIENVLEKDVSLTGRTYIWRSTIQNIIKSPIIGYGVEQGGMINLNYTFRGNAISSHNFTLEIMMQTGVVGLILFYTWFFSSLKRRKGINGEMQYQYNLLLFAVFSMLIMWLASYLVYTVIAYIPNVLCNNIETIQTVMQNESEKPKKTYVWRLRHR